MARASDVDGPWVARQRAANRPWAVIARMAGCAEADLRRLHDPRGGVAALAVTNRTPFEAAQRALTRARLTEDEATIVARLWLAGGAWKTRDTLTRGIATGRNALFAMKGVLKRAEAIGVRVLEDGSYYALSEDGARAVNALMADRGAA